MKWCNPITWGKGYWEKGMSKLTSKAMSRVHFSIKNGTEVSTEVIHRKDSMEADVILKAKMKLISELGINIDFIADKIGINEENHGYDGDWIYIDPIEFVR